MNINLNDHRARLNELLMLVNLSEDIKVIFKDVDSEHGKKESEAYIIKYCERLTDFFKSTMENAKVIGNIKVS